LTQSISHDDWMPPMNDSVATDRSRDLVDLVRAAVYAHREDRGPLLLILHDLQNAMGFIHPEAIPLLAAELNLSRADVYGVVTFYRDFRDRAGGRSSVRICRAEACQSVGADSVAQHARTQLRVDFGETTADGRVRLDQVFCLGNCALGPSVEIDGVVYGRVNAGTLDTLLARGRP
jgi:formate dehydrogenase subunit gamma